MDIYCLFNDVGRVSWREVMTGEPCGDCEGPMLRVFGADLSVGDRPEVGLCERHWLQLHPARTGLLVAVA